MAKVIDILMRGVVEIRAVKTSEMIREWVFAGVSISLLDISFGVLPVIECTESPLGIVTRDLSVKMCDMDSKRLLVPLFEFSEAEGRLRELIECLVDALESSGKCYHRLMIADGAGFMGLALVNDGAKW